MRSISFIGSGNVAQHLAGAFKEKGFSLDEVYSAHEKNASDFANTFGCEAVDMKRVGRSSDLIVVAVPDGAIGKLANELKERDSIVVHTSGSISIDVYVGMKQFGVFYPLQTFTRGVEIDLSNVPICIEASNAEVADKLKTLAFTLSSSVHEFNSHQRKFLHTAAVTVNNFSNHLYHLAAEYLNDRELNFELLQPLIMETARKISDVPPAEAQTGPAKRGDVETIEKQIELLKENQELQKVYTLFSEQILKKYYGQL